MGMEREKGSFQLSGQTLDVGADIIDDNSVRIFWNQVQG